VEHAQIPSSKADMLIFVSNPAKNQTGSLNFIFRWFRRIPIISFNIISVFMKFMQIWEMTIKRAGTGRWPTPSRPGELIP